MSAIVISPAIVLQATILPLQFKKVAGPTSVSAAPGPGNYQGKTKGKSDAKI